MNYNNLSDLPGPDTLDKRSSLMASCWSLFWRFSTAGVRVLFSPAWSDFTGLMVKFNTRLKILMELRQKFDNKTPPSLANKYIINETIVHLRISEVKLKVFCKESASK